MASWQTPVRRWISRLDSQKPRTDILQPMRKREETVDFSDCCVFDMAKECEKLSRKEVEEVVNKEFAAYAKDLFKTFRDAGFPDLKALGFADEVSRYLAEACVKHESYYNNNEIVFRTDNAKQAYLQVFKEKLDKKKDLSYDDLVYYVNDSFVDVLKDVFEVSFSIGKGNMWSGCFERGKRSR